MAALADEQKTELKAKVETAKTKFAEAVTKVTALIDAGVPCTDEEFSEVEDDATCASTIINGIAESDLAPDSDLFSE